MNTAGYWGGFDLFRCRVPAYALGMSWLLEEPGLDRPQIQPASLVEVETHDISDGANG
jgi:hypothetical protein